MKFLIPLLMLFTFSVFAEELYEGDIFADEAYNMQEKGEAVIIDVRTSVEYIYVGHGEGFINIPLFDWTYEPKDIETRVQSASYEIEKKTIKDHVATQKLYNAKERENKNFVSDVMKVMKLKNVDKVILVCRSGPRSKVAANMLAKAGISAYNLEDGFIFGWQADKMPWGGQ